MHLFFQIPITLRPGAQLVPIASAKGLESYVGDKRNSWCRKGLFEVRFSGVLGHAGPPPVGRNLKGPTPAARESHVGTCLYATRR